MGEQAVGALARCTEGRAAWFTFWGDWFPSGVRSSQRPYLPQTHRPGGSGHGFWP